MCDRREVGQDLLSHPRGRAVRLVQDLAWPSINPFLNPALPLSPLGASRADPPIFDAFRFFWTNPPCGRSWKTDHQSLGLGLSVWGVSTAQSGCGFNARRHLFVKGREFSPQGERERASSIGLRPCARGYYHSAFPLTLFCFSYVCCTDWTKNNTELLGQFFLYCLPWSINSLCNAG